jgi:hypothetical protein
VSRAANGNQPAARGTWPNGNRFKEGQVQQQASVCWRQMLEGDQVNLLVKKEDEVKPRNLVATPLRREEGGFKTPSISKEEVLWIRYQKEAIAGR